MAYSPFEQQVRERVEQLLNGAAQDTITGGTSVRCAVGLVVAHLDGLTTLDETSAWAYLDRGSRAVVHKLKEDYADQLHDWHPMPRLESQMISVRQRQADAQRSLLDAIRYGDLHGELPQMVLEAVEELRALTREERDLNPPAFYAEIMSLEAGL